MNYGAVHIQLFGNILVFRLLLTDLYEYKPRFVEFEVVFLLWISKNADFLNFYRPITVMRDTTIIFGSIGSAVSTFI